ncbi:MAG: phospholipase [Acidobacteria bacterium]|nr:phospholipase [Acidobacteriota bacterium]
MPQNDPIEHVIMLMLENHSFDQLLGSVQVVNGEVDGVNPNGQPHSETDYPDKNHLIAQLPTSERFLDPDPRHDHPDVLRQLDANYGFVVDYLQAYPHTDFGKKSEVMGYYKLGELPILHTLAQNFAVCDRWFSSLPGPTWPNRYFAHSGTSKGHVDMPTSVFDKGWHCYDQPTIFTRLSEAGKSWRIYYEGMPHSLTLLRQWEHVINYYSMERFFEDTAGAAAQFPQYCFIEPCYSGVNQNDQHPPSDVMRGELLIGQIYNAVRANDDLWKTALFVLLWDEHGGFYDHCSPPDERQCPQACRPDENIDSFEFDRFGVRVPALLISPWILKDSIHTIFDHTSLLRYLSDKWSLGPLGNRSAKANSFAAELTKLQSARTDVPETLDLSKLPPLLPNNPTQLSEYQHSLISFSHLLEQELWKIEAQKVGERAVRILDGPEAQVLVATERFEKFLSYKAAGTI